MQSRRWPVRASRLPGGASETQPWRWGGGGKVGIEGGVGGRGGVWKMREGEGGVENEGGGGGVEKEGGKGV